MFELQAPIVPTPDTSSLQYVAKGLASMVAQRQHNQQLELAYQKMAQDALIDQQKVDMTRQQLAQQLPLQQAQISNLNSEASMHNAQAYQIENVKAKTAQDQQEALDQVTQYTKDASQIPSGVFGTQEGLNQLSMLDAKYPMIGNIRAGQVARASNYTKQRREELNSISNLSNLRKNYDDTVKQSLGRWATDPIIATAPGQLDYKPGTTDFQPNNVWGVNKSGDPFLTVNGQKDSSGQWIGWQIVPPDKNTKDSTFVTIPKTQANSMVALRDQYRAKTAGLAGPPPSTVQAVQQQASVEQQQNDAIEWVKNNPDDPRTPEIRKRLGLGP